jgi:hypothetical protein
LKNLEQPWVFIFSSLQGGAALILKTLLKELTSFLIELNLSLQNVASFFDFFLTVFQVCEVLVVLFGGESDPLI